MPFPERRLCNIIGGSPDLDFTVSTYWGGGHKDALAGNDAFAGY